MIKNLTPHEVKILDADKIPVLVDAAAEAATAAAVEAVLA